MDSAVVLLNGGIGSATAAYRRRESTTLHLLYLDYGAQAAKRQLEAANALADALRIRLTRFDLPHVAEIARRRKTAQTTPRSSAQIRATRPDDLPGFDPVLLSIGAQFAATLGAKWLVTGHGAATADATGQQLSRERSVDPREFHHAFAAMLEASLPTVRAVQLESPLLDLVPGEILKLADRFSVPLEATWSCNTAGPPCGTCSGCLSRATAFAQAARPDPLLSPAVR